jgi:hypothetical protein
MNEAVNEVRKSDQRRLQAQGMIASKAPGNSGFMG